MSEETRKRLAEWADRLGKPIAELERDFADTLSMFKKNVPGKTDAWYEDAARRRMFLEIKGELQSPSRPFDVEWLGYSSDVDVTAAEMEEKKALWVNPQTREQAVAEGKVSRGMPNVPDGTPLDTREWMIPPNPGTPGRRNRQFGKPLQKAVIRNYVGLGRPATGGPIKLISLMGIGADRIKALPPVPPKFSPTRVRMNIRADEPSRYVCNMSTKTKFEPTTMPEFPSLKEVLTALETAPPELKRAINELPEYHQKFERDPRRTVIVEGDVSRINREPTPFGSLMLVLEDTSKEDLEAEGLTVWVPGELDEAGQLDFGQGSRVFAIGRTTIGPGYNRETGQLDQNIKRIMLNAVAVLAIPEFRVPPEEESVVSAEVVK